MKHYKHYYKRRMGDYSPYVIDLTELQLKHLAQGRKIIVKHSQFGRVGSLDTLMLTATQIKKAESARKAGKGFSLQFSVAQYQAQATMGSGRFSDWFRKIGTMIKDKVIDKAQEYGSEAIDVAGALARGATHMGLAATNLPAQDELNEFANSGIEAGKNWSKTQLQAFLNGLRSTKQGSGILNMSSGIEPIDLRNLHVPTGGRMSQSTGGSGVGMRRIGSGIGKDGHGLYLPTGQGRR